MAALKKVHVKKGEKVMVITGKDAGKIGKVIQVMPKVNRVVVEGVNITKRHTRPTQKIKQGGILEIESAIDASNVMYYCPSCKKPSRVGVRIEDSNRIRICKRCGNPTEK
jgi:large subunit ribosomal protein L24